MFRFANYQREQAIKCVKAAIEDTKVCTYSMVPMKFRHLGITPLLAPAKRVELFQSIIVKWN